MKYDKEVDDSYFDIVNDIVDQWGMSILDEPEMDRCLEVETEDELEIESPEEDFEKELDLAQDLCQLFK